jgi:glutaconate CoA-transferase subunit A
MALVRETIRQGLKDITLIPAPGSVAPDMLIGAGVVKNTACVFISFEQFGLAPQFRKAAENGLLTITEMDGPAIAGGLRAGSCDLPYGLIPDMCTDLPRVNPKGYQPVETGPGERRLLKVPAIKPDVVLLHAQQADELGNVQYRAPVFFDVLMAQAARYVIVTVDRIVSHETVRKSHALTKLPSAFVDAVVEAPFGAHPTVSAGFYDLDAAHIAEYVRASSDEEAFQKYLSTYVRECHGPADYCKRIGNPAFLTE